MDILYGFAHLGHLVDNAEDVVGPVGELSSYSMTFARDKLLYNDVEYPNLTLVSFQYQNEVERLTLGNVQQTLLLSTLDWVYKQARFANFSESIADFQAKFLTEHGGKIDLIDSGVMVNFGNNQNCPEFITVSPPGLSNDVRWVIWLSDEAFRNQSPVSHIFVIPPIMDLDRFFEDAETVYGLVMPPDMVGMNDSAEMEKGQYPHTALRTWSFDWVDQNNVDNRISTIWLTGHYGDAGNNLDQAKEAIRDYILKNSNRGREEWAPIFPDIFTSTEFIVVPHYDLIAVPSKTRQSAIYSPTTDYATVISDALRLVKGVGYTPPHIESVIQSTSSLYRSLAISLIGGPENRDGINKFNARYPDYINVATTHVDFGYMQESTREFVMVLNELLMVCEAATPSSTIPRKFNRIVRDDQVYIGINFDNFLWLVVPKYAYGG